MPPLSLISEIYLKKSFGHSKVTDSIKEMRKKEIFIKKLKKFFSLPSWKIEALKGKIDLFVNFISFQEMEPFIVQNYIKHILRLKPKYILLRNLREGKQKVTKKFYRSEAANKEQAVYKFAKKLYLIEKTSYLSVIKLMTILTRKSLFSKENEKIS